ncbi:MAG: YggS family pyridoxal phosphate-dependent enzyme [Alphaproteobacteria bacterium]|nr:YggS family pyridoxal phosphate-dependent enzyme [Alphaproteobacteria bacterium]
MPTAAFAPIAERLAAVRARIAEAARRAGRPADAVSLVAISKTHPAAAVEAAIAAGQRVFGENRVQEAEAKFPALKARYPDLRLHLVGPLQTNKARNAVRLFDVIHTLDRPRLAEALARAMDQEGRRPTLLVEVNIDAEPQKAGIAPEAADGFIADCRARWRLAPVGLMCIPPAGADPAPHFARLAAIAERNGLKELSMGMSDDFEIAVARGATLARIGTAIFGPRER